MDYTARYVCDLTVNIKACERYRTNTYACRKSDLTISVTRIVQCKSTIMDCILDGTVLSIVIIRKQQLSSTHPPTMKMLITCWSMGLRRKRPCFGSLPVFSGRPVGSGSASLRSFEADDLGAPGPTTYPQKRSLTTAGERTYAQKIRDEFYEKERKRLPSILRKVERALAEAEQDNYGEFRGLTIFQQTKLHRGTSARKARLQFCDLICKRHALRHGFHRLHQMLRNNELGKSIMGRDTNQALSLAQARNILIQFWCYGRSTLYENIMREEDVQQKSNKGTVDNRRHREVEFLAKIDIRHQIADDFASELRLKIPALQRKSSG